MTQVGMSKEDRMRRAEALYEQTIRFEVETDENIGKMVIIDIETGDYAVDELGIESARIVRGRHPDADLFGLRIGYNVAASIGGTMERIRRA